MTAPGWEGLLDADESILWQGQPDTAITFKHQHIITTIFGVVFAVFAAVWMLGAARAGGYFWMFGLIHFCIGLGLAAGPFILEPLRARRTWYTLTNKRAFIAETSVLGQKTLQSIPINADTVIDMRDDTPPSIYFGTQRYRSRRSDKNRAIGFVRIDAAQTVLKLIRDIQQGKI